MYGFSNSAVFSYLYYKVELTKIMEPSILLCVFPDTGHVKTKYCLERNLPQP